MWRLGVVSSSQLLGVQPDIAAYAKLLTGGPLPAAAVVLSRHAVTCAAQLSIISQGILLRHAWLGQLGLGLGCMLSHAGSAFAALGPHTCDLMNAIIQASCGQQETSAWAPHAARAQGG